ncbi:MAG TPA: hypothetical protein VFT78_00500 [Hanamia sp.]|nr:hypothetical protein [Hanamia sp.]
MVLLDLTILKTFRQQILRPQSPECFFKVTHCPVDIRNTLPHGTIFIR